MKYNAEVIVTLKNGVRDPQGAAIDLVLKRTSLESNAEVGAGKYFTLSINAQNEDDARLKLNKICEDVLSNPILESFRIERLEKQ